MEHKGYWWTGTIIAIISVVVGILAWQLPKNPSSKPTSPPGPANTARGVVGQVGESHDVPNDLLGGWRGIATSPNEAFVVQLNLQQGGEGEYVGAFLIPVAGCRSDVILTSGESEAINAKIQVKTGACVSGTARFSLQSNGLRYQALTTDGQSVVGLLQRT